MAEPGRATRRRRCRAAQHRRLSRSLRRRGRDEWRVLSRHRRHYRKTAGLAGRALGKIPLARLTTAAIDDGYTTLYRQEAGALDPALGPRVLILALNRAMRRGLIATIRPSTHPCRGRKRGPQAARLQPEEVTALLAPPRRRRATRSPSCRCCSRPGSVVPSCSASRSTTSTSKRPVTRARHGDRGERRPVARERGKSAAALRTLALPPTVVTLYVPSVRGYSWRCRRRCPSWPALSIPGPGRRADAAAMLTGD